MPDRHPPAIVFLQARPTLSQLQSALADCFESIAVEAGEPRTDPDGTPVVPDRLSRLR
ncbi:MAG TPA: hypothetical protein VKV21_13775 [Solirubrobacteraceae bacterium]|nr:hypothetical protein [Solirubrobacteraceae bacterium]